MFHVETKPDKKVSYPLDLLLLFFGVIFFKDFFFCRMGVRSKLIGNNFRFIPQFRIVLFLYLLKVFVTINPRRTHRPLHINTIIILLLYVLPSFILVISHFFVFHRVFCLINTFHLFDLSFQLVLDLTTGFETSIPYILMLILCDFC